MSHSASGSHSPKQIKRYGQAQPRPQGLYCLHLNWAFTGGRYYLSGTIYFREEKKKKRREVTVQIINLSVRPQPCLFLVASDFEIKSRQFACSLLTGRLNGELRVFGELEFVTSILES